MPGGPLRPLAGDEGDGVVGRGWGAGGGLGKGDDGGVVRQGRRGGARSQSIIGRPTSHQSTVACLISRQRPPSGTVPGQRNRK